MNDILNIHHVILDIETSGLNKTTDFISCIGVLFKDDNNLITTRQWMIKNEKDEKSSLEDFLSFIRKFSHIYTFSGKSFDIPFLLAKLATHGLDSSIFLNLHSIDLKKHLSILGLDRASLESAIKFDRECSSSGKDIAKISNLYLSTGENIYKLVILAHNTEELNSILGFYEIYQTLSFIKESECSTSFSSCDNKLIYTFKLNLRFIYSFSLEYKTLLINWKNGSNTINICISPLTLRLKKYLLPSKDYYYIISQNQIVHKSIAQFIDREDKRKVKKDECNVYDTGSFIPLISKVKPMATLWFDDNECPYLKVEDLTPSILAHQLYLLFITNK